MPEIKAIPALCFSSAFPANGRTGEVGDLIAPPYDVLDEGPKQELLGRDAHNIVAIDLPFTPPKVVGPDEVYARAGEVFRQWRKDGTLVQRPTAALYVYQQSYTHLGQPYHRRGVIANVKVQEFGPCPTGGLGGVYAHEQTFASGKEDRLKLMRACKAQLSPIFGIYRDPHQAVSKLLAQIVARPASFQGQTSGDGVLHSVWEISDPPTMAKLQAPLAQADVFIADGHHRYHTALNYRKQEEAGGTLAADHPSRHCMFVLVAMEDPGMIVLPTHRVLCGMDRFKWETLARAAEEYFDLKPFHHGDLATLEQTLPKAGPHAIGLYAPGNAGAKMWVATCRQPDPLAQWLPDRAPAWRQLDVAIVQHLLVERICQPECCAPGQTIQWKFPHELVKLKAETEADAKTRLGVIVQPTPLAAVMAVSAAGELMPQKSTFFYPKLATGLVVNPLE